MTDDHFSFHDVVEEEFEQHKAEILEDADMIATYFLADDVSYALLVHSICIARLLRQLSKENASFNGAKKKCLMTAIFMQVGLYKNFKL